MTNPSLSDKAMREGIENIDRAVRILTALTEDRFPDPDDVAALRRLVPEAADKTVDEMVCEAIRKIFKHRRVE
jgi:hypothetical protein